MPLEQSLNRVTEESDEEPRKRILANEINFQNLNPNHISGAFVIPFLIMMVLEGMPLLLLELGIGQRLRRGSYVVWNLIDPRLGGIGLGSTVIAVLVGCYYNMIIAWCIYYLIKTCSVSAHAISPRPFISCLYFHLYCRPHFPGLIARRWTTPWSPRRGAPTALPPPAP